MAKIPVEKAIGGAYGFLFSNIFSIIGIVWLPYLVFGGLAGALVWYGINHLPLTSMSFDPKHPDIAALLAAARLVPPIIACLILGVLIATIGLTRKALGLMPGPTFIYFTLGAPLWRLLGALFLIMFIVIGVVALFVLIAVSWTMFGYPRVPQAAGVLISFVGGITMFCLYLYTIVRLYFFLPAVVVAEERIGVGRSWALGGGNFWRMIVVFLMVILPPAIALGLVQNVLTTMLYGPMPMPPFVGNPHPDLQAVFAFYKTIFLRMGPVVIGLQVVIAIVIRALYAGAVANAYRGVTASAPPAE